MSRMSIISKAEGLLRRSRQLCASAGRSMVERLGEDPLRRLMAISVLLLLPVEMFCQATSKGCDLLGLLLMLSAFLIAGIMLQRGEFSRSAESKLLVAFSLWMMATRVLLGDTGTFDNVNRMGYLFFSSVVCIVLPSMYGKEKDAHRLLSRLCDLLCGFAALDALLGVAVIVFRFDVGFGGRMLSEYITYGEQRFHFIGMHPNINGVYFIIGVGAALIRIMESKKTAHKAVYAAVVLFIMMGLAISDSRTCNILTSVLLGVCIGLVLFDFIKNRKTRWSQKRYYKVSRLVLCGMLSVAIAVVSMAAISLTADGLAAAGNAIRSTDHTLSAVGAVIVPPTASIETAAAPVVSDTQKHENAEQDTEKREEGTQELVISEREYGNLKSILTLSYRTALYEIAIENYFDDPIRPIFGELYGEMKELPIIYNIPTGGQIMWPHYHSSIFATMYETGLPGLALMLAFIVLIVIRMFRIFFAPADKKTAAERFLIMIPAAIMINALTEPLLFNSYNQSGYFYMHIIFILFCGFIIRETSRPAVSTASETAEVIEKTTSKAA